MLDQATYRDCPACGAGGTSPVTEYSPDPWQVVDCDACSFVFLRNPPEYEAFEDEFAWEKTHVAKRQAAGKGSTRFSPLARRIRDTLGMYRNKGRSFARWFDNGHVLDVGCGAGPRVPQPMVPYGIELSRELHRQSDTAMRARGGFCIHGAGAEAIWDFDPEMFDGVVMFSYLEHETQIMKVLRGAFRALKPGGGVFIRVPNYASLNRRVIGPKWCGFRYPDHVNYFTLQSLRDVAARAGFTCRLINWISLPVDDNVSVLLRKTQSQT